MCVWGRGNEGQLGLGDTKSKEKPTQLRSLNNVIGKKLKIVAPPHLILPEQIKFVAAGGNHTFAVTFNNNVYAWGDNHAGQLGIGPGLKKVFEPTLVKVLPVSPIVAIQTSRLHTLLLTGNNIVCLKCL